MDAVHRKSHRLRAGKDSAIDHSHDIGRDQQMASDRLAMLGLTHKEDASAGLSE